MLQFDKDSTNCIAVMYPTGGYGNFLYYLLAHHFDDTVKLKPSNFEFSNTGNSHCVIKYVEIFALGQAYHTKNLKNFTYTYQVTDQYHLDQINVGKKFTVLCDMGNLGDNVAFLKRYFTNAKILRIYAESFDEKLILWANAINKAYINSLQNQTDPVYKTSLHTVNGIATFANKPPESITDQDAIDCTVNFFKNNFESYGKMFNEPVDNVVNIPLKCFFSKDGIIKTCQQIAKNINSELVDLPGLDVTIDKFLPLQKSFKLLDPSENDSIILQALQQWQH